MLQSLITFFDNLDNLDLDTCDQEQLHLSGAVQARCGLIALDSRSYRIIAYSENIPELLDLKPEHLAGTNIADVRDPLAQNLMDMMDELAEEGTHKILDYQMYNGRAQYYDFVAHLQGEVIILDVLPSMPLSLDNLTERMRTIRRSYKRILQADGFQTAVEVAVEACQEVTGFHRVKFYKFLPDWSGDIIAESAVPGAETYLGSRFPAKDIPKQARHLYQIVPYRAVMSVDDHVEKVVMLPQPHNLMPEPLDLSRSLVRSVSPIHTQYLRNMRVSASFSTGLISKGKLIGLIVCHHDRNLMLPYDIWGMIHDMADVLALKYEQEQHSLRSVRIEHVRQIENRIADQLRLGQHHTDFLQKCAQIMWDLIPASGFALQYGGQTYTVGDVPPVPFINDLLAWGLDQSNAQGLYHTTKLHEHFPPAVGQMDVACGVLMRAMSQEPDCRFIWFRSPVTQEVKWAGNPEESKYSDGRNGKNLLTPRHSFASWVEMHSDQSETWTENDLDALLSPSFSILDVLMERL